jgi:chitodextrinase
MSGRTIAWIAGVCMLAFVIAAAPAAARDRTPPTTPTNLHITGSTPSSVSLAWSPSTDNGRFWYCVQQDSSGCFRVDPPQTTFTRTGLAPDRTFTFAVYAVDAAGNRSGTSNSVSYTTPPDTTPPSPPPTLTAPTVLPTRVALSWTASTDDRGGQVFYTLFVDGTARSVNNVVPYTVEGLAPDTTHVFKVVASDASGNTAESNVLSVTTPPATDLVPPSAPTNLNGFDGGCGEAWLNWSPSTDDVDPPSAIRYDVYVNGQPAPESSTIGSTSTIAYARVQGTNTFVVRAVDSSGNVSEPSNELPIPGMWPC